jgi:hypothetical protein
VEVQVPGLPVVAVELGPRPGLRQHRVQRQGTAFTCSASTASVSRDRDADADEVLRGLAQAVVSWRPLARGAQAVMLA